MNKLDQFLSDILHEAALVDRIRERGGVHYMADVENNQELLDMKATLESRVNAIMEQTFEYQMKFENYAWIWEDDK